MLRISADPAETDIALVHGLLAGPDVYRRAASG